MSVKSQTAGLTEFASEAVERCLSTLAKVVGFHIVELWVNDSDGFSLFQVYTDWEAASQHKDDVMGFHLGQEESITSRNLCKRALNSKHGFFWQAKRVEIVHPKIPYHAAVAIHLPRDNINSDVYVCAYSFDYIKVDVISDVIMKMIGIHFYH